MQTTFSVQKTYWQEEDLRSFKTHRVKLGNFGHRVNSDRHMQTVEILMRRLLMSRLIRICTVCLVNLFFIPIIKIQNKQGFFPNLADLPKLPDFTLQTECMFIVCMFTVEAY